MGSFSKKPDEAEEKADSVETNTAAVANCGVNKEEEEVQKEAENDVFSGLSNHEDACDDDLSREQRSFARYESPRDAEGREENVAAEEGEKKDEVAKETVTKLPTFDSPISAITWSLFYPSSSPPLHLTLEFHLANVDFSFLFRLFCKRLILPRHLIRPHDLFLSSSMCAC